MGEKTKLKLKSCFGYVNAILIKINYVNCFTFMPNYHAVTIMIMSFLSD